MTSTNPPSPRRIPHEGGLFARLADETLGPLVELSDLRLERHPPERVELARRVWADRVRSELRSVQIMNRFLGEVVAAGDPIEVYAGAVDLIADEVRHVRLCVALCEALGGTPTFPEPLDRREPEEYARAPAAERACHTAIAMLCVNETVSVAFVEDLRARCEEPAVRRVLEATLADEEGHEGFGWAYAEKALARFPRESLRDWQHLVARTLEPHRRFAEPLLAKLDADGRGLADLPEPELAALGLSSPERQALVMRRCWEKTLGPRLRRLGILPAALPPLGAPPGAGGAP